MNFSSPLQEAFENMKLLYNKEFELDSFQSEFANINLAINLIIALEAVIVNLRIYDNRGVKEALDKAENDLCTNMLPETTTNTFKICSSKDEASKLYLELIKMQINVDPQEMDTTECKSTHLVKAMLSIRRGKYLNFISSAKSTLGLDGSIAIKVGHDSVGKNDSKHIHSQLISILSGFIENIEAGL